MFAEESCLEAGGLFLARVYQSRSHFGFSKFLPRQLLRWRCERNCEHVGSCCKLLGHYCSKLLPFLPFSSHPDDLPALGGKNGWLSSCGAQFERAWDLSICPLEWPVAGGWFSRGMCLGSRFKAGSTMEICVLSALPFIWSQDIFVDLIGELCSSMQPGEIRRILPTGVEILPSRTRILLTLLNVFRGG